MSEPASSGGRTSLFERASAALGVVLVAAAAAALGYARAKPPAAAPPPAAEARLPLTGPAWRRIAIRALTKFNRNQIPRVAGGVAFFALLSVFPALAAFVSLYGLFADVDQVPRHLAILAGVLPPTALAFVAEEMLGLAGGRHPVLGAAFGVSLLASLLSANGAVKALFAGLNTAYDTRERRSFIQLNLTSLGFTVVGLSFMLLAIAMLVTGPSVLRAMGWHERLEPGVIGVLRWPVLFIGSVASLSVLYRFGPCSRRARWRWTAPGCIFATLVWLGVSMGFSWYVGNFAQYERTYGSLGAVVGFMTWLWLSAIVILAGAELNAEIEAEARSRPNR